MATFYTVAVVIFSVALGPAETSTGGGRGLGVGTDSESVQLEVAACELLRCGPIALQLCSAICDRALPADAISDFFEPGSDENSLSEVRDAAHAVGLSTLPVKWLRALPPPQAPPAVIPIVNSRGRRHFVAMVACRDNVALIVDVPHQAAWISEDVLRTKLRWQGEALHIASSDAALGCLRSQLTSGGSYFAATPWVAGAGIAVVLCFIRRELRLRRQRSSAAQAP